jgi:hypothetical protein
MKKTVTFGRLMALAFLMLGAPLAMAHDRSGVNWSVTIGSSYPPPVIYSPPPVVYVPVQPVYVQPYPAYVRPYPTYVQPHPTYIVPQPIYVQPAPVVRFGNVHHDRFRHHHHAGHERRHFRSHGQYYGRD